MPIKTFQNGFPLPASDLNNFLMNQSVMTFATSAARDSAITSPIEGMITYLEDSNKYETYDGAAWVGLIDPDTLINPMTSAGDLIVGGASGVPERLAIGDNTQLLSVVGSSLEWIDIPAAGPETWTLLNSGGTSLSGTTTTISSISGYSRLKVVVANARTGNTFSTARLRINSDSGANYFRINNRLQRSSTGAMTFIQDAGTETYINIADTGTNAGHTFFVEGVIEGCNSTGQKVFNFKGQSSSSGGGEFNQTGYSSGAWNNSSTVSSISYEQGGGTFNQGTIYVYGA
jgi:hypothetical protein